MKQFRITTENLNPQSNDDCVLDPNDPIYSLMPASTLGGLGSSVALEQYINSQTPKIEGSNKGQIAREQNIQPGTDAWFKHWFGKENG
jgi:hypothetical protein